MSVNAGDEKYCYRQKYTGLAENDLTRVDKSMLAVPLVAGLVASAVPALAQETYGRELLLAESQLSATEFMSVIDDLGRAVRPAKFVSIQGIGSGTVAPGGMVFGSISGTNRTAEQGSGIDGSFSLGAGFGNADSGIGSQITANITAARWDSFGRHAAMADLRNIYDPADAKDTGFDAYTGAGR